MKGDNQTSVTEFILLGLTEDPDLQFPLFVLFLLIYIITVVCNVTIMALIKISPRLHTPMYFLLSNLSFVDLCYSSVITPKMLNMFLVKETISLSECVTQFFFFVWMATAENFLLTVMSYDRYVAICKPLRYTTIMTKHVCTYTVFIVILLTFLQALIQSACILRLAFCGSNEITHFYCDVIPLLKLACSDTTLNVALLLYEGGSIMAVSVVLIIVSYIYIICTILRISSSEGRWRTFSTCSSHFASVTLLYGTLTCMYIRPSSKYSIGQDQVVSVFYTVVIPMVNPLIYSLRNKDVKDALRKVMHRITLPGQIHLKSSTC
ncbi:olfactory receptor 8D1-like [Pleurodeles waltl]|uniref:olfactory receptor 8D1-like n=1 Tax=Pleurodeles waltl TaxID=8319 RepID=UPI00370946BA